MEGDLENGISPMKLTTKQRTFWNFLVANFFALVPLWVVAFGWMPDQIKVYMRETAAEPVSIVADGSTMLGEDYGTWTEGRIWRFYLREGMEWKDLVFRLPGDLEADAVARIELQKWKLLSLGKSGAGLKKNGPNANGYRYPNPRFRRVGFVSKKMGLGFLGLECLLFAGSWFFARRHREEQWRGLLPSVLGVSLALTLLIEVVLPIQSYIANRSSFPFLLSTLCGVVSLRFALMFVWNTVAIFLLVRAFGRWILAPIFAFAVCAYLESGILAEGQPSLNGDWTFFADSLRARWDAAAWGGVFILVLAVHRWLKNWYGVAGLGLVVMLAASMLDTKSEQKADTSNLIVHDFVPLETVIHSVTYSSNRNVMVFVIDSLEREQAHAVMEDSEAGPELREKFRGFTEYADNVGAGWHSPSGVANLFTGKYLESAVGVADYFTSVYSADSVLKDYLADDWAVYTMTESLRHGFVNGELRGGRGNSRGDVRQRIRAQQAWRLDEISRFRWLPFGCKLKFLRLSQLRFPAAQADANREWEVYPILEEALQNPASGKDTFAFFHTDGMHLPIVYDRNGERLAQETDLDAGGVEFGVFLLRQLSRLFDAMREAGVYDNSLIFVLADHGRHGGILDTATRGGFETETELPHNARPFLWVKPEGSTHEFRTSPVPTSHANVSRVLREACTRVLPEQEIQDLLQSDRRLFRLVVGEERFDWIVDSNGRVQTERGTLNRPRSAGWPPLPVGRIVSLSTSDVTSGTVPEILFSGLYYLGTPYLEPNFPSMDATFRVPDARKRYSLHFSLECIITTGPPDEPGACMKFRQAGQGTNWIPFPVDYHTTISLHGLVPDADGLVTVEGERGDGLHCRILFTHVKLEEER